MADLGDKDSALTVKIAGASSTGLESQYVNADLSGNIFTVNNNGAGASAVNIQDGGNSITVDATSLPLPTGAATETTLSTINGKLNSLGQKTMANSVPVVVSSDQSAIPVSQSGTWNINNVSGTVSLPTGASTSALQTTGNNSLASIDAGIPAALGQTTMASSMPVVLASDQSTVAVGGNVAAGATDSGNPVKVGGKFNTALPTLTNGQRGDLQLDASSRQIIAPLTNTSVVKAQVQDNAGNAINSYNGQLQVSDIINGGIGVEGAKTIGTTAVLVNVSGTNLVNREMVSLHNNSAVTFYWGHTSGVTITSGTPLYAGQFMSWAYGSSQNVYIIAGTVSNNARVTEA